MEPIEMREGGDAKGLIQAADARSRNVRRELEALEERRTGLDQEIERLRAELGYLDGLLELHGARPAERPKNAGRPPGSVDYASVEDLVVSIIREAGVPLHFREIETRARRIGVITGGKDPANVLLARYFNETRLYRPARGTYALREWNRTAGSVGARRVGKKGR